MENKYCTLEFGDGRIYQAKLEKTTHNDKEYIEPFEILIDGEWKSLYEFEDEDVENTNYACTNYRAELEMKKAVKMNTYFFREWLIPLNDIIYRVKATCMSEAATLMEQANPDIDFYQMPSLEGGDNWEIKDIGEINYDLSFAKVFYIDGQQLLITKAYNPDHDEDESEYELQYWTRHEEGLNVQMKVGFPQEEAVNHAFDKIDNRNAGKTFHYLKNPFSF